MIRELIAGVVVLFLVAILSSVLHPIYTEIVTTVTGLFPGYLDPNVFNGLNLAVELAILGTVFSVVIYIIMAGMRRQPGADYV
jgi:hypothetical protein